MNKLGRVLGVIIVLTISFIGCTKNDSTVSGPISSAGDCTIDMDKLNQILGNTTARQKQAKLEDDVDGHKPISTETQNKYKIKTNKDSGGNIVKELQADNKIVKIEINNYNYKIGQTVIINNYGGRLQGKIVNVSGNIVSIHIDFGDINKFQIGSVSYVEPDKQNINKVIIRSQVSSNVRPHIPPSNAMKFKTGDVAPDFKLKDVNDPDGRFVSLSDYIGPTSKEKHVVMLVFWATWCDICKKEMPNLIRLNNYWKDKGFVLLSVVLQSGNIEDVNKIVADKKINYSVLLDQDLSVSTKIYGLAGPIPLKVVIDQNGIIRYTHVGENTVDANDDLPFIVEDLVKELHK